MKTDEELLKIAMTHTRGWNVPRWAKIMTDFSVSKDDAHELCTRFGLDPDQRERPKENP